MAGIYKNLSIMINFPAPAGAINSPQISLAHRHPDATADP